jgi:hypothetical protein
MEIFFEKQLLEQLWNRFINSFTYTGAANVKIGQPPQKTQPFDSPPYPSPLEQLTH